MKQEQSIENDFNEGRRGSVDQELERIGWAGMAGAQQRGAVLAKKLQSTPSFCSYLQCR